MANSLLITKLSDGSFSFIVNGDAVNVIINLRNDMTSVGTECHFKSSEGANLIKLQQIQYNEVTIVDGGTLPVATSPLDLRVKLRSVGFWDWMSTGGSGVDAYQDLIDTLPFFGNDGKIPIVNESQLRLDYIDFPNIDYLNLFPSPLQALKAIRVNAAATAYEFYDVVNLVTQFIRLGYTATSPSEDIVYQALALKADKSDVGITTQIDREANGIDDFVDIGTTENVKAFFYGSVLQETSMWSQAGSVITFAFVPDAGAGVNNLQFI